MLDYMCCQIPQSCKTVVLVYFATILLTSQQVACVTTGGSNSI